MGDPPKIGFCNRYISQKDKPEECHMHTSSDDASQHRDYVDITAMIRSLQRTEGFADCFRTGLSDCDQIECAWRQYCLQKPNGLLPE
jgi:hypothetical protein